VTPKTSGSPIVSKRWLQPLRLLWFVTLATTLVALALATPILYSQGHQLCFHPAGCDGPQLPPAQMRVLHQSGVSIDFYAGYVTATNVIFALVYCTIAAVIFVRRSYERMGLLSSFFLVVFGGLTFPGIPAVIASVHPVLHLPAVLTTLTGASLLALFFATFPNGRFVPSWTRWFVFVLPVLQGANEFFPDAVAALHGLLLVMALLAFLGSLAVLVGSQIYRYRRVSTPSERQQTKWVVLGMGVGIAMFMFLVATGILLPPSAGLNVMAIILPNTVMYAFMLLIPLSIAIAITRSNLWAVDTVINRTLVYVSLTISLATMYILGVIAIQALFRAVTGQASDLAVAIATLAVAALFNPWRRRVQIFIDRRFYRKKYDSARTLSAFQSRLRDGVDLDQLSNEIVAVLQDTINPSAVAIWLPLEAGTVDR